MYPPPSVVSHGSEDRLGSPADQGTLTISARAAVLAKGRMKRKMTRSLRMIPPGEIGDRNEPVGASTA
ncbi:conserved hypothetical protein [Ricinus communis]|uniref:Uncharacterized protein n=1 Tax=Ricinus communis TaxID=3988 RepID=B9TLP4_RICCO|nr:conserved hypothetical protein [Ricinus communis]